NRSEPQQARYGSLKSPACPHITLSLRWGVQKMQNLANMKTTPLPLKHSMNGTPYQLGLLLIPLVLACFALSPQAGAVCQHGCDLIVGNTFLGDEALISNTTGNENTATGAFALPSNTSGFWNTASGSFALVSNSTGSNNTATGVAALANNTTAIGNTATGVFALYSNDIGYSNIASGVYALFSNSAG